MKVKCKQCNNIFDYEKYDGICNKCCHYYGKEGMEDSELIKNRQYKENNSYERNTAQRYATSDNYEKEEKIRKTKQDSGSRNQFVKIIFVIGILFYLFRILYSFYL